MAPQEIAARLVWELAKAGMPHGGAHFLCDDEANQLGTRGPTMLHRSNAESPLWKVSDSPAKVFGQSLRWLVDGAARGLSQGQYSDPPGGR